MLTEHDLRLNHSLGDGGTVDGAVESRWFSEPPFLAAATFLAIVLFLAGWLFVNSGSTPHHATKTATPTAQAPAQVPVVAPAGTQWNLWYGIALPSLANSPTSNTNDVPAGFAHTPEGALIAASQLPYRCMFGAHWHDVADKYVTGPGQDAFLSVVAAMTDHLDTTGVAQLAGFRFDSYSPDKATIELVTGQPTTLKTALVTVMWANNTWQLVTDPSGAPSVPPTRISNLLGYATWQGVAQ